MASSINATFGQRPKAFNGVHVNDASSVLFSGMSNLFMVVSKLLDEVVTSKFVRVNVGIDIRRYLLPEDGQKRSSLDVGDYLSYNRALPLDDAHNRCFVDSASAAIAGFAAKVRFINFNCPRHLRLLLIHNRANLSEHAPCCFISDTCFSLKLFSGNPTPSRGQQEESMKPSPERGAGLVEDRSGSRANLAIAEFAFVSLATFQMIVRSNLLTLRAKDTLRPASILQKVQAGFIIGELSVKVFQGIFCGLYSSHISHLNKLSIAHFIHAVKGYLRNGK